MAASMTHFRVDSIKRSRVKPLNIQSAVLIEMPKIVLDRTNIQAYIQQICKEPLNPEQVVKLLGEIETKVDDRTRGIDQRADLDSALGSTLRLFGLVYRRSIRASAPMEVRQQQRPDTVCAVRERSCQEPNRILAVIQPPLRTTPMHRVMAMLTDPKNTSDVLSDTVLPSIESPDPATDNAVSTKISLKQTRSMKRPKPQDHSCELGVYTSPSHRFCQNIGHWLESLFGANLATNYVAVEVLAGDLFRKPISPDGVLPLERDVIKKWRGNFVIAAYRSLRARILIGLALVYEHNLRGDYLNRSDLVHPACRPDVGKRFRYLNLGISQAQMIAFGTDVGRSSAAYHALQRAGYIPSAEELPNAIGKQSYDKVMAVEMRWSERERGRLYAKMASWYHQMSLSDDLVFVIGCSTNDAAAIKATAISSAAEAISEEADPVSMTTARNIHEI